MYWSQTKLASHFGHTKTISATSEYHSGHILQSRIEQFNPLASCHQLGNSFWHHQQEYKWLVDDQHKFCTYSETCWYNEISMKHLGNDCGAGSVTIIVTLPASQSLPRCFILIGVFSICVNCGRFISKSTPGFDWCTDTSDPRHFGPKTVPHYIFGTEMSYFFVSVPKCLWDTSALVLNCLNILWRGCVQRTFRH